MKTKSSHTPTPWTIEGGAQPHQIDILNESVEKQVCLMLHDSPEDKANAAFIVKAVNAYHRHSEALGRILALCKKPITGDPMVEVYEIVSKAMDSYDVQEAIAKAEVQ